MTTFVCLWAIALQFVILLTCCVSCSEGLEVRQPDWTYGTGNRAHRSIGEDVSGIPKFVVLDEHIFTVITLIDGRYFAALDAYSLHEIWRHDLPEPRRHA